MDRALPAIAVTLLVLLAGCSLGGGGSTATPAETVTPAPTPEPQTPTATPVESPTATPAGSQSTPTPTATPADGTPADGTPSDGTSATPDATPTPAPDLAPVSSMEAPPGVEGRQVTNGSALVAAHRERLRASAYRVDLRIDNSTGTSGDIVVRNGTSSTLASVTTDERDLAVDYYYDETVAGVYNRTTDTIRYSYGSTSTRFSAALTTTVYRAYGPSMAQQFDWHAVGVRTTDGGEKRLVLTATGVNEDADGLQLVTGSGTVVDVEGRMEVTADGVVRRASVTTTSERPDGDRYTQRITYSLGARADVTVSEPGWLESSPQIRVSVSEDDSMLVVEHTGGAALVSGTTLSVGPRYSGGTNVTLEQQVSPDDTLYLYRTGETNYTVAVNDRPTVPESATAFTRSMVVRGRLGQYVFSAGPVESESGSGSGSA